MYGQERGKLICRICQVQRKSASSAKDAFCNANGVFARRADFLQYCGRALRARSLRFLIPQIEALKARRYLAKHQLALLAQARKLAD